jgi:hypothetical protein
MAEQHEPEVNEEPEDENGEVFPDREAMSVIPPPDATFPLGGPDELPPSKPA